MEKSPRFRSAEKAESTPLENAKSEKRTRYASHYELESPSCWSRGFSFVYQLPELLGRDVFTFFPFPSPANLNPLLAVSPEEQEGPSDLLKAISTPKSAWAGWECLLSHRRSLTGFFP